MRNPILTSHVNIIAGSAKEKGSPTSITDVSMPLARNMPTNLISLKSLHLKQTSWQIGANGEEYEYELDGEYLNIVGVTPSEM